MAIVIFHYLFSASNGAALFVGIKVAESLSLSFSLTGSLVMAFFLVAQSAQVWDISQCLSSPLNQKQKRVSYERKCMYLPT